MKTRLCTGTVGDLRVNSPVDYRENDDIVQYVFVESSDVNSPSCVFAPCNISKNSVCFFRRRLDLCSLYFG